MKFLFYLMSNSFNFTQISGNSMKLNDNTNGKILSKIDSNGKRIMKHYQNNTDNNMNLLKFLAINALDLTIPASDILWKNEQVNDSQWLQLSGHPDSLAPAGPGTIWKRISSDSEKCIYESLMTEPNFKDMVPFYYRCVEYNNEKFIELQDLLSGFDKPVLMDIKMGTRTFQELEIKNKSLRTDLYKKMYAINANVFTNEEHVNKAITKCRYMQLREEQSSSKTLGFRLEAIKLPNENPEQLSTIQSRKAIDEILLKYVQNQKHIRNLIVHKLNDIRTKLENSEFFQKYEFIGSSFLFIYDNHKLGIWLIDFGKTIRLPNHIQSTTHRKQWIPGNYEEGFLFGLDNLITIFENLEIQ